MLELTPHIHIPETEIRFDAIRASGPGGQNVNKVSSAVHLRFDIAQSSLPQHVKERLLNLKDSRISKTGTLVIKAQQFRTREKNKEDALERLRALVQKASIRQKNRRPTRPTRSSKQKRLNQKSRRGNLKKLRGRVRSED
ncbi:MAG: aminoacyl-tRNA hydrolase [Desulfobacterales bacterium]|nr:aminoacyl-tRNA hydrolase [Desulfobacterales bacterium]